jgi:hypothetical protein
MSGAAARSRRQPFPSQSRRNSGKRTARRGSLRSVEKFSIGRALEPYLRYNGEIILDTGDMDEGDGRKIDESRPLNGEGVVTLHEEDCPDRDDFLGRWDISSSEAGQGEKLATFTGADTHYTLLYKVENP